MAMNPQVIKDAVCAVLKETQEKRGLECPDLAGNTKPLKDLPNFTSPVSIGATGKVAKKLKIVIPPEVNIFGNEQGLFTIDKTVAIICSMLNDENKKKGAAA
jgi:hypothetical protein